MQLAQDNNIEIVANAMIGESPNKIVAEFSIDETAKTIITYPAGYEPSDRKHKEITAT